MSIKPNCEHTHTHTHTHVLYTVAVWPAICTGRKKTRSAAVHDSTEDLHCVGGGEGEGRGMNWPVHSNAAHHDCCCFLIKPQCYVASVGGVDPVTSACRHSNSPLTTGVLVLRDKLDTAPATLRHWCSVLKLKEERALGLYYKNYIVDYHVISFICPVNQHTKNTIKTKSTHTQTEKHKPLSTSRTSQKYVCHVWYHTLLFFSLENRQILPMFSLRDLRFMQCSFDLDYYDRAQRIMDFFTFITHKSTKSENSITWYMYCTVG